MIKSIDEIKNDFLISATEINNNRAFPDAKDGLKPSQRAALWTMNVGGFTSNKPHVKSAKVSGNTIASYWPHGDVGVYDTIVRMSQPWVNNLCEVDFHGGNGSLQGGPDAASSRYTECRLSKVSEDGFFTNIKQDTVDMIPNFSEDLEWPSVFPAIFPRLFINGSQGIGYTIAQEWEPGNLNEFTDAVKGYIKNGKVDCSVIYPDYPTGGVIINKKDIHTIYETGKGSIILRGKVEIEDNLIKITELPYQVYAEPFIASIKELVNKDELTGIEDICNKSGDHGLLIEIECSEDPEIIVNKLYKLTNLQTTFSANQMALVDGVPKMLPLKEYIKVYVDHNLSCILREHKHNLNIALNRQEVVDGLIQAIAKIDDIIDTIKAAKNVETAKTNLTSKFGFSSVQAQAIVDMRLGKLANLESVALQKESDELKKTIEDCNNVIGSEKEQKKILIKRLEDFTKKYGWERRTQLTDVDIVKEKAVIKKPSKSEEQFMVVLTKGNYLKRIALVNYKSTTKFKNPEDEIVSAIKIGAKEKLFALSCGGLVYKIPVKTIPLGMMNSTGINLGYKFINIFSGHEEQESLFMITSSGKVKKFKTSDLFRISKLIPSATSIIKLDSDQLVYAKLVDNDIIKYKVGKKEKTIDTTKYKSKGRSAGGVNCIKIKEGQTFELN